MNFPKFWAKGSHRGFDCWRWSDTSLAEAAALAQEAARKIAERFAEGSRPDRHYGYANRPLREPVLRELRTPDGELTAVISRNSYGCPILNTARVMFVDVDLPEPKPSVGAWFKKLFGKPEPPLGNAAQDIVLARAEAWVQQHPGWGWRIYRTRAGLRLLATHAPLDPEAPATEQVFEAMRADPLYRRLCKTQKCFRARLLPKPWRCNIGKPPARWPWPDDRAEADFKKWEARYEQAIKEYATCKLIGATGARPVHPIVQVILRVHDEATKAEATLPLA